MVGSSKRRKGHECKAGQDLAHHPADHQPPGFRRRERRLPLLRQRPQPAQPRRDRGAERFGRGHRPGAARL